MNQNLAAFGQMAGRGAPPPMMPPPGGGGMAPQFSGPEAQALGRAPGGAAAQAGGVNPSQAQALAQSPQFQQMFMKVLQQVGPQLMKQQGQQGAQAMGTNLPPGGPSQGGPGAALAAQGQKGDTTMVHATPGELMVPPQAQTPKVLASIRKAFVDAGEDPRTAVVGGPQANINPQTGVEEHGMLGSILGIVGGIVGTYFGMPMLGAAAGSMLGGAISGDDAGQIALGGVTSAIGSGLGSGVLGDAITGNVGGLFDSVLGTGADAASGAAGAAADATAAGAGAPLSGATADPTFGAGPASMTGAGTPDPAAATNAFGGPPGGASPGLDAGGNPLPPTGAAPDAATVGQGPIQGPQLPVQGPQQPLQGPTQPGYRDLPSLNQMASDRTQQYADQPGTLGLSHGAWGAGKGAATAGALSAALGPMLGLGNKTAPSQPNLPPGFNRPMTPLDQLGTPQQLLGQGGAGARTPSFVGYDPRAAVTGQQYRFYG